MTHRSGLVRLISRFPAKRDALIARQAHHDFVGLVGAYEIGSAARDALEGANEPAMSAKLIEYRQLLTELEREVLERIA